MAEKCCPEFHPEAWDKKRLSFAGKKFAKDSVFCLWFVPVGFGSTMTRLMKKVEAANAACPDGLCLADHKSKWKMDIYLEVDKDLPGTEMHSLPGTFLSKVYEGPFNKTKEWCEDFASYAKSEGLELGRQFMWYTTCPKCAKERGKNYVAILGEIRSGAERGAI